MVVDGKWWELQSSEDGKIEKIKLYNCIRITSEIQVQHNAGISKYLQWKEQIWCFIQKKPSLNSDHPTNQKKHVRRVSWSGLGGQSHDRKRTYPLRWVLHRAQQQQNANQARQIFHRERKKKKNKKTREGEKRQRLKDKEVRNKTYVSV